MYRYILKGNRKSSTLIIESLNFSLSTFLYLDAISLCVHFFIILPSLLRNLLGLGSLMAFPGSMFGALLCGLAYHKTKNLIATVVGEVFGTSILGGLCAWPVAIFLMGKSAADIAFYAYIVPFLISTAVGAVIAGAVVFSLQRSGALRSMQNSLS